MSLASASLKRPVTTMAATLAIVLLGAVSLTRLPVSLLPDITLPVLTIRTVYPGAAATEASRLVAEPIEQAVASTPGLADVRSVARNGEVTTTLHFNWGTDMPQTVLLVRERLDNARAQLPERAERPTLLTSDPGERPIAVLALSGKSDLQSISRTAEDVHARRLEQLAGVASVAVAGKPEEEIRVEVDPEKARALGITPDQIASRGSGRERELARRHGASRPVPVAASRLHRVPGSGADPRYPGGPAGAGIRLRDLATVRRTVADPLTLTRLDGKAAVGLVVYKDAGSNTVTVTRDMYGVVEQLRGEFPDITIRVVAAQAQFVTDALSNLGQEIVLGGILSLLVILLFLGDVRTSLAIGLMVPLSVLTALVILQELDVTNQHPVARRARARRGPAGRQRDRGGGGDRTLSGDRTLQARRCTQGGGRSRRSAHRGTLTTLLVFGPIVFVRGLGAALFRDLSLSVVTTVAASLVLALTVMPVLMIGRRTSGNAGSVSRPVGPLTARLHALGHHLAESYENGMKWSLSHPATVFTLAIALTVFTTFVAIRLPREILPSVDEGIVVASLKLRDGTAIEETTREVARVEAAAHQLKGEGVYARIGTATDEEILAGAEPGSSSTAQILIPVPRGSTRARSRTSCARRCPISPRAHSPSISRDSRSSAA
jgi:HAE1 family hydrophobic/amphiphilic exporter-1